MSYIKNYLKLKDTITQNEKNTHKQYNQFTKIEGELTTALSLNPQFNNAELWFLEKSIRTIKEANNLIINLREEARNKDVLIKGMEEVFEESLELMKDQSTQIKEAKAPSVKGGKRSRYDDYEEIIMDVLSEYVSVENKMKPTKERLTQSRAIEKIESQISDNKGIEVSTFNNWYKLWKEKKCLKVFN